LHDKGQTLLIRRLEVAVAMQQQQGAHGASGVRWDAA
jgi:hypothetical protein